MTLLFLVQSHQSEENSGSPHQLQPRKRYGDTHGSWYASVKGKEDGANYKQDVHDKHRKAHFNNGFIGTAENFTNIWLPHIHYVVI
jgi:hypothetical protein